MAHGPASASAPAGGRGWSRRAFLKGAVTAGAAAVAAGAFGPQRASAAQAQPDSTAEVEAGGATVTARTYTTDVVVVGSGLSGLMAARNALGKGANVLLVDKGPFGRSGASGINWGHELMSYENSSKPALSNAVAQTMMCGLADQAYYRAVVDASIEMKALQQAVKTGTVLERSAVGEDSPHNLTYPFLTTSEPVMPRFIAQSVRNSAVQVLDRTMVLDVLQDPSGAAAGIVGLDLVEGQGVVVRAKAVVMCTGSPCWANGWTGSGAKTNASPENTGDGLAILLNHGVPVKNLEQWDMYFYNVHPSGIAFSQGIGVSVGDHPENMMNADGEHFLVDNPDFGGTDRCAYEMLCMKEVYEGRGNEYGGLWYDTTRIEEPDYVMAFNRRVPENHRRALRYTDDNPCELVPTPWECAGSPQLSTTGETAIPGLFWASAGDMAYGGSCATVCTAGGWLAGAGAAERAAGADLPSIDQDAVQKALGSAFAALDAAPDDGVRAKDVMHAIQNIMNEYCWMGRTGAGLERAIEELGRVRDELMPNMAVLDKSTRFNQEWRQALEVPFMWNVVMATAQAALARTESRGSHHRLDYPKMDNVHWLKNVYVSLSGDGAWSVEARDVNATALPKAALMGVIAETSL